MPSFAQIGMRIGTRSVIAAVGSRKHPTTSMSTFASSRKTQGLCVKASTQAANASVTCATVSSQPKMDAAATMNRTAAVVSMVSMVTLTSRRHASVRYQTSPRKRAHSEAAIAPSVGVNTPSVMPPISITGVSSAITAEKSKTLSRMRSSAKATMTAQPPGMPKLQSTQAPPGTHATVATSSAALMSLRAEKGTSRPKLRVCAK